MTVADHYYSIAIIFVIHGKCRLNVIYIRYYVVTLIFESSKACIVIFLDNRFNCPVFQGRFVRQDQ